VDAKAQRELKFFLAASQASISCQNMRAMDLPAVRSLHQALLPLSKREAHELPNRQSHTQELPLARSLGMA
jgi:hypothetical protein